MSEMLIKRSYPTVTVLDTASLSDAADFEQRAICGMIVPVSLAATTVRVQFHGSLDGVTYGLVKVADGSAYEFTVAVVAAIQVCAVDLSILKAFRYLKVLLTTSGGTPVAQTADKIFTLVGRDL